MRDARLAAIREEAADMFATLPSGAVRVRAMQLLAMVDARDAEVTRLKAEVAALRKLVEESRRHHAHYAVRTCPVMRVDEKGLCNCGAETWNAKVNAVLGKAP